MYISKQIFINTLHQLLQRITNFVKLVFSVLCLFDLIVQNGKLAESGQEHLQD